MPNTCQICRAARLDRLIDCEEFDRLSIAQRMYKRSETCSLIPVPPHGRLIDADALPWIEGRDENDNQVYLLIKNCMDVVPAIIPASQEGEG